ncbi:Lrp/AsnC family transcriptional regulator [candidate division KSB1 bacterium]
MNAMNKRDLLIISHLRKDARKNLTSMSRETGIPVSTIFDRIRVNEGGIIKKHVAIVDFTKLGYTTRANLMLKIKKEQREELKIYLSKQENINSVYKINNNYDFLIEGIFTGIKELESFLEKTDDRFDIESKEIYYIVDEIKKEEFMAEPKTVGIMG